MKNYFLKLLKNFCLGIGTILIISPIFTYWYIHGNYERYLLIINKPAPFSNFGSGPYQLFYLTILPILLGIILIKLAFVVKKINTKKS